MANAAVNLPMCTNRYAIFVSYIGTRYKGSQRLINRKQTSGDQDTIQEALEASFESLLPKEKCRLTAGSRTDKGVHSLMSCYALPLMDYKCPTEKLKQSSNLYLLKRNHEIVVNEVFLMPADFHPQRAAVSREYIYRIGVPKFNRRSTDLATKARLTYMFGEFPASELFRLLPLPCFDLTRAEEAANLFRGEHDFASFCYQSSDNDDTIRSLEIDMVPTNDLTFEQEHSSHYDIYHFRFKSRAFLYHQIRRIMGAIISYASFDRVDLGHIKQMLDKPNSASWSPRMLIAEPWGLYLSRMNYAKSSFQGTKRTYEDNTEVAVPIDSIPCLVDDSDDLIENEQEDDAINANKELSDLS